jgi:hypothetical protein
MTHCTDEQIQKMVSELSNEGNWIAFDHEAEEFPELGPEDRVEGGAWWLHRVNFVDYGDYSCFCKADAEFIANAPSIVKQQHEEIAKLHFEMKHDGEVLLKALSENERLRKALTDLAAVQDWHGESYSCRFCHHQGRTPGTIKHSQECKIPKLLDNHRV